MKKLSYQTTDYQTHWRIMALLLIFALCLISFDSAFAQTPHSSEQKQLKVNGKKIKHKPRDQNEALTTVCDRLPNRTIDGTCNNIENDVSVFWGASDIALYREMYPAYGMPDFYNDMSGNCRLSPRAISNIVVAQSGDIPSPRGLSSLVFTWGQFIDHDIDLTPEGETEYMPVLLPSNEPLFVSPIPFLRSEPYPGSGVTAPREQQNIITSWLDASQVYGSEETRAHWLRTFSNGKLKTSPGDLLPYNTLDGSYDSPIDPNAPSMAGDNGSTAKVFVAGDVRANEQPGLTALHTLFVREHNRICNQMSQQQGGLSDEVIYQRARKRVGAYIQAITYNRFLSALGVHVAPYNGYDDDVQADIKNIFATAAYRLGHTMVTDEIPLLDRDCSPIGSGSLSLIDGFFNPSVIDTYGIAAFLQGLASQTQQKCDVKIVDNLRNFLFGDPSSGNAFGLDLASLNIQRGRDHGLPDYNSVRAHYTGFPANSFSDITSDVALQQALEEAYGSVYDMDPWVGLLSEDPLVGSSVGMTMNAILAKQFEDLRNGDFYYYKNDPAFSNQQRNQISNIKLRDILLRNTEIENLQHNVFFAAECDPDGRGGGHGHGHGGGRDIDGDNGSNLTPYNTLTVFPNPTNGNININLRLFEVTENVQISIHNLDGKALYQESSTVNADTFYYKMDLKHLPPGMYFITIQAGTELFSEKIVID